MAAREELDGLVERLAAIPGRIARAVEGWSEERVRARPAGGEWSAAEVLAHMRACDDINAYRAYVILVRDNPPLIAFDERHWEDVVGYAQAEFQESLATFAAKRAELVALLERQGAADWERVGAHEEFGTITLLDMITRIAWHEEEHCGQIEALSAGQRK